MRFSQIVFGTALLMDKAGEGTGGGGTGTGAGAGAAGTGTGVDAAKELADLKTQHATLLERLDKIEKSAADPNKNKNDEDLTDKVRKDKEAKDKAGSDTKKLEAALKFTMGADLFLKTNEALLPKDISDIFKMAEKENFSNAVEKRDAVQAGIIQSFFSIQANLDLLTANQKTQLEDYLKLTKTSKQEKAAEVFDNIFEPSFEMLKRIKKAEQLSKTGAATSSDADEAYKQKLIGLSQKHYLGEKSQNAKR